MPLLVLTKEVQTFIRACEHLLSMPSSPPICDDEGALLSYYIQELSNKYGAPKADRAGSAESCATGRGDQSLGHNCYPAGSCLSRKDDKRVGNANLAK